MLLPVLALSIGTSDQCHIRMYCTLFFVFLGDLNLIRVPGAEPINFWLDAVLFLP
jgi:hypothetical protein